MNWKKMQCRTSDRKEGAFPRLVRFRSPAGAGLFVSYVFHTLIARKIPLPLDKLLLLKKQINHCSPTIDISVSNTDEDAVGASEYIQKFLYEWKSPIYT